MNTWMFITLVSVAVNFGLAVWMREIAQDRANEERVTKRVVGEYARLLDAIRGL